MTESTKHSLDEEQLIARYFNRATSDANIDLSIGDDAAVINVSDDRLAVAADTMVEGVHFEAGSDADDVGHKALAVNLSDLAAMGAKPRWATLALTMPAAEPAWLKAFSDGFFRLADEHQVALIGGDTTRGALTITVQLIGILDKKHVLRRDKAQAGEGVYLTGRIADAGLVAWYEKFLKLHPQRYKECMEKAKRPIARVAEGLLLAQYTTTAIDISDGILKDLTRVLSASKVGAEIEIDAIPTIPKIAQCCPTVQSRLKALSYGEDYELLFTLKDEYLDDVKQGFMDIGTAITRIGTISETLGLRCSWQSKPIELPQKLGYDHFT